MWLRECGLSSEVVELSSGLFDELQCGGEEDTAENELDAREVLGHIAMECVLAEGQREQDAITEAECHLPGQTDDM